MRLVEEKHRALPRDVRRLAQFRVDEVIVRHEYDVRAARHVAGEVIRTRAAPAADFSPLPDVDQILDVHGVRLAEIGIRLDETIHLVVMRTRARVRLGLTRRVLRHPRERGNVLVHAHLLARTDDRHARTVPRGAKFANHLGQLTVRARRADDDGAAAGGPPPPRDSARSVATDISPSPVDSIAAVPRGPRSEGSRAASSAKPPAGPRRVAAVESLRGRRDDRVRRPSRASPARRTAGRGSYPYLRGLSRRSKRGRRSASTGCGPRGVVSREGRRVGAVDLRVPTDGRDVGRGERVGVAHRWGSPGGRFGCARVPPPPSPSSPAGSRTLRGGSRRRTSPLPR